MIDYLLYRIGYFYIVNKFLDWISKEIELPKERLDTLQSYYD